MARFQRQPGRNQHEGDAAGTFQHVVFRLHGSLPGDLLDALRTSDPAEDQRQAAINDMLDRSL
ncbi:hypothetical protein LTR94_034991, partial [Friedmanniomyces endolithicus]